MKLDWQWPGAVIFAVVFLTLGGLVFTGKLPPEVLSTILAWLIPSPMQFGRSTALPPQTP